MRLAVLAVSQDSHEATTAFLKLYALSFPFVLDTDALAISRLYELETTPTLIFLAGREKLQRDADTVERQNAFRVMAVMEGWDKIAFEAVNDQMAARLGALPCDTPAGYADVPDAKPGGMSKTRFG